MLFILPFLNYFTLFSSKFCFRSPLVLSVQFFFFCFERDPQIVLIFLVSFIIVMYFFSLPLFFSLSVLQVVLLRQERWRDMLKNLYTDIPQIQKKKNHCNLFANSGVKTVIFVSIVFVWNRVLLAPFFWPYECCCFFLFYLFIYFFVWSKYHFSSRKKSIFSCCKIPSFSTFSILLVWIIILSDS